MITTTEKSSVERVFVEVDGLEGTFAAWVDRSVSWNGFAVPYFERAEAERVMRAYNLQADVAPMVYDAQQDAFHSEDYEPWHGVQLVTPDSIRTVYAIGGWSWSWMLSTPLTGTSEGV